MRRVKTFIAGVLCGAFLVTGVAFASDQPEVMTFINAKFLLNGKAVNEGKAAGDEAQAGRELVEIDGEIYWSLEHAAVVLGLDWEWDRDGAVMELNTRKPVVFETMETVPDALRDWLSRSLTKELGQSRVIEDHTYLLVTRGEKRTGGYEVAVQAVELAGDQLVVTVAYTDPDKGDIVTEGVTYPYELVRVEGSYERVDFILTDGTKLPQIDGMSAIPSLIADADGIMVFGAEMRDGRLHVSGAVHAFAGTVWLKWQDADGTVHKVTVTTSASAPDWGRFEVDLAHVSERGTLSISSLDAEGDDWREVSINYPMFAAVPAR
jgi:hypothetical protein